MTENDVLSMKDINLSDKKAYMTIWKGEIEILEICCLKMRMIMDDVIIVCTQKYHNVSALQCVILIAVGVFNHNVLSSRGIIINLYDAQ